MVGSVTIMKKYRVSSTSNNEELNLDIIVDCFYVYDNLIHRRSA